MNLFSTFLSGLLFAIGLSISGMTMPSKVINFLDIFGHWDISLMFVMIGAISVYSLVFHLIKPKMAKPVCEAQFKLPTQTKIDVPLVTGAITFGAGWDLRIALDKDLPTTAFNFAAVMDEYSLREKVGELLYIDMRFDDRVYYKVEE